MIDPAQQSPIRRIRLTLVLLGCLLGASACGDGEEDFDPEPATETRVNANASIDGGLELDAALVDARAPEDAESVDAEATHASVGVIAAGVRWMGRVDLSAPDGPRFAWSGTGFAARFSGTGLTMHLRNVTGATLRYKVVIDGEPQPAFATDPGEGTYVLARDLAPGVHTLVLQRQTEGMQGISQLLGLEVEHGSLLPPPAPLPRSIELIGDSISAGLGLLGMLGDSDCLATESHWDSYGARAARALEAELSTVAASGRGVIRNYRADDASSTMPELYLRTLPTDERSRWHFGEQPDVVVINLGTNDISNRKGDPGAPFEDAYVRLLELVREKYPEAAIMGMIGPMLGEPELSTIRARIRAAVARRNAAGDHEVWSYEETMTQTPDKFACTYHPNAAQNALMGEQLAHELRLRLGWD